MYDPCTVFTVAADSDGGSNGIISNATSKVGVRIHKLVLRQTTSGSNVVSVLLNDHVSIGSSATLIALSSSSMGGAAGDAYARYTSESFDPPIAFQNGVSIDITGTAASCSIYYTRQ